MCFYQVYTIHFLYTEQIFRGICPKTSAVFRLLYLLAYAGLVSLKSSVADPDPDPVEFGLFWSPGSRSGKIPDPDPL